MHGIDFKSRKSQQTDNKGKFVLFLRWAVIDQKSIQVSVATQSFTFLLQSTVLLLRPDEMGWNAASLLKTVNFQAKLEDPEGAVCDN